MAGSVGPTSGTVIFKGAILQSVLNGPQGPVARDLARRANAVRSGAVARCPVDTGRLRASIRWSLAKDAQGLVAIVGTDVKYAVYVHEGTRFMAARPFLRDALADIAAF